MKAEGGKNKSFWLEDIIAPDFPPLGADIHSEVCVVGGGIAGLTTAYHLALEGRTVIVLEDGTIGGGETSRTTAHLSNALDDGYQKLEHLHGLRGAQLAAESHTAAINRIEQIVRDENIPCDFERLDGFLFSPPDSDEKELREELDAAHRAGLTGVRWADKSPLPGKQVGGCLCFPNQAQFHPMKYLLGLARAIVNRGGQIYQNTHAEKIEGGKVPHVRTRTGFTVTAKTVVVATNTPVNDRLRIHTKQAAYRSYVIGMKIPQGSVPKALYWDTLDPYHYVRLSGIAGSEEQVLMVGGGDHKTGQPEELAAPFMELEKWAQEHFAIKGQTLFRWSGQVMEPVDALAFIGRNPLDENIFVATGDSGHGMTHGTIAGILLTDLIAGRNHPWAALYEPSRKTLRAAGEFLRESLNMAGQYRDWMTAGEVESEEMISPGSGAVVRHGAKKVAVYRDETGACHACSPICPHLGGLIRWNDVEKTWDCPCHGSRFDRFGTVVNGPAISNLKPEKENIRA